MSTMQEISVEEIEQSEAYNKFLEHCPMYSNGFVRYQPGGCVLPPSYAHFHERMKGFKLRDDDIWVASFPKSGTTWTQEMVWNILNNVDLESAKNEPLDKRVPFLELSGIIEGDFSTYGSKTSNEDQGDAISDDSMHKVDNLPLNKQRLIKTHLPVELMPSEVLEKHKIIYVSRNPRDVVLSLHNHWTLLQGFHGGFDAFFDVFIEDVSGYYAPFFPHNINYWNIRKRKNIMFIFYEDMKKDLKSVIKQVSEFLDKDLSENQIERLHDHLQFKNMKENPAVNKVNQIEAMRKSNGLTNKTHGQFFNKGKSGGWKDQLSEHQISRIEAWEQESLKGSDLSFQYD